MWERREGDLGRARAAVLLVGAGVSAAAHSRNGCGVSYCKMPRARRRWRGRSPVESWVFMWKWNFGMAPSANAEKMVMEGKVDHLDHLQTLFLAGAVHDEGRKGSLVKVLDLLLYLRRYSTFEDGHLFPHDHLQLVATFNSAALACRRTSIYLRAASAVAHSLPSSR